MAYTVKKLSELSGVTVRALHFYEELGLLKPTYYGSNGYRYYEEKELLQLQQILFFKELGFSLKAIRKVLGKSDFDQLAALYSHKQALSREWEKVSKLLKTIDKTINHLKGKKKMKDKEIFNGFVALVSPSKGNEPYFQAETLVLSNLKPQTPVEQRGPDWNDKIAQAAVAIYHEVIDCMDKGLTPSSAEVQRIMKKHHASAERFHNATAEVYAALAELYEAHPAFRKQLDLIHPKLAKFLAQAMKIFAAQL